MKKQRRAGATETFSVSVDAATKQRLKALAAERHGGNVSALIAELALEGARIAAMDRAWAWYGGPEPTAAESAAMQAEWEEGWALARSAPRPGAATPRLAASDASNARVRRPTAERPRSKAKSKAKRAA